jgi:hypothetical protein
MCHDGRTLLSVIATETGYKSAHEAHKDQVRALEKADLETAKLQADLKKIQDENITLVC